jgi:uncharacterized protein (TIGR04255 family)
MPELLRFWFINDVGTEILQIQPDRFVHNWRKVGEEAEYPRYERIRRTFLSEFLRLSRVIKSHLGRELMPNQCEITYVNYFGLEDAPDALEFFRMPEDFPQIRFAVPGPEGHPIGRLIVQAGPAVTRAGARMFQLMLTVRGRPSTADLTGARKFMDMGRAAIVSQLCSLDLKPNAQKWGLRE